MGGILAPIDNSLVSYTPGTPGFSDLVSDELGDLGTSADGFDADLSALIALLPDGDSQLDAIADTIAEIDAANAANQALDFSDLVDDWNTGIPVIDQFQANLALGTIGDLTIPALPAEPGTTTTTTPTGTTTCVPVPCPSGYTSTSTGCQPTEQPAPTTPVIPPEPGEGGEPCPTDYAPSASGGCAPADPDLPVGILCFTADCTPGEAECDPTADNYDAALCSVCAIDPAAFGPDCEVP